ncbi:Heme oxygenase [Liparis tanakae]|uniref:Heme oxygenase n=1 Tax=Liparis tanakae TaxID=230148 RepID=A0A4Z2H103_9TELE|nr:Heme oxygenase [Liparis tanakae]
MEAEQRAGKKETGDIGSSDLSEQVKAATKDSHVRAENTELMLSYQRGHITLPQYKVLLCSLYEIYKALEEELDRNSSHPAVAPIFFPQELARLETLERDLEHFLGPGWRRRVVVPGATRQVLGKITQKSLGLSGPEGLSFFSFPGVTSPNRFKQLYRGRMNAIELTAAERAAVLQEAVAAFELNIQVFDDLQKMLSVATETADQSGGSVVKTAKLPYLPTMQVVGLCVVIATIGLGIYAI